MGNLVFCPCIPISCIPSLIYCRQVFSSDWQQIKAIFSHAFLCLTSSQSAEGHLRPWNEKLCQFAKASRDKEGFKMGGPLEEPYVRIKETEAGA